MPDLRYLHDHMGVDFLKLLVQYEDGPSAVDNTLWYKARDVLYDKLTSVGELQNMEYAEAFSYAEALLTQALDTYVARTD